MQHRKRALIFFSTAPLAPALSRTHTGTLKQKTEKIQLSWLAATKVMILKAAAAGSCPNCVVCLYVHFELNYLFVPDFSYFCVGYFHVDSFMYVFVFHF